MLAGWQTPDRNVSLKKKRKQIGPNEVYILVGNKYV